MLTSKKSVVELFETRWRSQMHIDAFVDDTISFTYRDLIDQSEKFFQEIDGLGIPKSSIVMVSGDMNAFSFALLWACIKKNFICIPHITKNTSAFDERRKISGAQFVLKVAIDEFGCAFVKSKSYSSELSTHVLYSTLQQRGNAGIVLFSSGTSGEPKAAVHDLALLLNKFSTQYKPMITLGFLLFDHWGGLNTIFSCLANCGTVVCPIERSAADICRLIEKFKVELLPVSPTFLNLFLASGVYANHDLSSVKVISYGAEPMPSSTLDAMVTLFPSIKFKQTYGLIELGVFSTKSKAEGSLYFQIDRKHTDYRIVENMLQIKTISAMLGYLNSPSPFTSDGWFITGDEVQVDGDYIRVLGRKSEMINVGGEKVFPTEVESALLTIEGVVDALVYGEPNFLVGNIVCAKIQYDESFEKEVLDAHIKKNMRLLVEPFKVPIRLIYSDKPLITDRFKKSRV